MPDDLLATDKSIIELHRDLDAAVAEVEAARSKVCRIQRAIDLKCRKGMGQIMAGRRLKRETANQGAKHDRR